MPFPETLPKKLLRKRRVAMKVPKQPCRLLLVRPYSEV